MTRMTSIAATDLDGSLQDALKLIREAQYDLASLSEQRVLEAIEQVFARRENKPKELSERVRESLALDIRAFVLSESYDQKDNSHQSASGPGPLRDLSTTLPRLLKLDGELTRELSSALSSLTFQPSDSCRSSVTAARIAISRCEALAVAEHHDAFKRDALIEICRCVADANAQHNAKTPDAGNAIMVLARAIAEGLDEIVRGARVAAVRDYLLASPSAAFEVFAAPRVARTIWLDIFFGSRGDDPVSKSVRTLAIKHVIEASEDLIHDVVRKLKKANLRKDMAQNAKLWIVKNLGKFDPKRKFEPWAATCIRREILNSKDLHDIVNVPRELRQKVAAVRRAHDHVMERLRQTGLRRRPTVEEVAEELRDFAAKALARQSKGLLPSKRVEAKALKIVREVLESPSLIFVDIEEIGRLPPRPGGEGHSSRAIAVADIDAALERIDPRSRQLIKMNLKGLSDEESRSALNSEGGTESPAANTIKQMRTRAVKKIQVFVHVEKLLLPGTPYERVSAPFALYDALAFVVAEHCDSLTLARYLATRRTDGTRADDIQMLVDCAASALNIGRNPRLAFSRPGTPFLRDRRKQRPGVDRRNSNAPQILGPERRRYRRRSSMRGESLASLDDRVNVRPARSWPDERRAWAWVATRTFLEQWHTEGTAHEAARVIRVPVLLCPNGTWLHAALEVEVMSARATGSMERHTGRPRRAIDPSSQEVAYSRGAGYVAHHPADLFSTDCHASVADDLMRAWRRARRISESTEGSERDGRFRILRGFVRRAQSGSTKPDQPLPVAAGPWSSVAAVWAWVRALSGENSEVPVLVLARLSHDAHPPFGSVEAAENSLEQCRNERVEPLPQLDLANIRELPDGGIRAFVVVDDATEGKVRSIGGTVVRVPPTVGHVLDACRSLALSLQRVAPTQHT